MTAFENLFNLSSQKKQKLGVVFTPNEILQQPQSWIKTIQLLEQKREELNSFLTLSEAKNIGNTLLLTTGAGSSEFIGTAVGPIIQRGLQRHVISVPTTHLVTHASNVFHPNQPYLLISFARSGNSPESVATYDAASSCVQTMKHLVITCNREGALAAKADSDPNALCIILPEETNDRSLVMTSSFSSMALFAAGLGYLDQLENLSSICDLLISAAERIFRNYSYLIAQVADLHFSRACFLGSNTLYGTMQECQLKMLEMTDGKVATRFESFLGVRHGPQVFIDDNCLVFASLSSDPLVRRYELDLLQELKSKHQGCAILTICGRSEKDIEDTSTHVIELYPDGEIVSDSFRIFTDVIVGQILATFKCLKFGLKPDEPSASGVISRVVQGVTIYDS